MASLRYRIWDRCTRRIPEGTIMPPWAVALNVALFPVRAMGALIYRRTYPFDIWTLTWNIHGTRFDDHLFMAMAGRVNEGWYKFSRTSDGTVIVERRMEYTDLADWQKKEVSE
jgi:hypothetical protein